MTSLGALTVEMEATGGAQFQATFFKAAAAVAKTEDSLEKFNRVLEAAQREQKQTEAATRAATRALAAQEKEAAKSAATMKAVAAGAALAALYKAPDLIRSAFDAANEGARNLGAQAFFKAAGKDIDDLRRATRGMVSDATLMKKANLADSMGISMDTFKTLARVAQASALKTGQSFEYMFDSIVVGTARSSRLLLDNLGIIVSVDVANQRYALAQLKAANAKDISTTAVNKFVAAMDDEAKKVAFADEVMRQSNGAVAEFAKLGALSAARFDTFTAAIDNAKDSFKAWLAEGIDPLLPKLTAVTNGFKDLFDLKDRGNIFGEVIWNIGRAINEGIFGNKTGASEAATNAATQKHRDRNQLLETGLIQQQQIESMTGSPQAADNAIQAFMKFGSTGERALDMVVAAFVDVNNKVGDYFGLLSDLAPAKGGGGSGGMPEPTEKVPKKRWDAMDNFFRDQAKDSDRYWDAQEKSDMERIKEATDADKEYMEKLAKFQADSIKNLTKLAQDEAKVLEDAAKYAKERADERNAQFASGASSIGGAIAGGGGLFSAIGAAAGPGIGSAVAAAIGAGGGPIGAIVGALVPILGQLIDKLQPVITLVTALADGLTLLVTNGLSELLNAFATLGPALRFLLASIGLLLGSVLRPLVPLIELIVLGFSYFFAAIAWGLTILSPFIELLANIFFTIGTLGATLIPVFLELLGGLLGVNMSVQAFVFTFEYAMQAMVNGVIALNNGIVKFVRSIPGMKRFGKILDKNDFEIESTDKNTDATDKNTAAVKDLAREFRNLPQGYRVASASYASEAPARALLPVSIVSFPSRTRF